MPFEAPAKKKRNSRKEKAEVNLATVLEAIGAAIRYQLPDKLQTTKRGSNRT